jgi:hypothetical protein
VQIGGCVSASTMDRPGLLTTRNVLDCADPADARAVPAGILAALIDT